MIPKFNFLPLPEYVLVRLHRIDRGGDNKDLPFLLFKVWTKLYRIAMYLNTYQNIVFLFIMIVFSATIFPFTLCLQFVKS